MNAEVITMPRRKMNKAAHKKLMNGFKKRTKIIGMFECSSRGLSGLLTPNIVKDINASVADFEDMSDHKVRVSYSSKPHMVHKDVFQAEARFYLVEGGLHKDTTPFLILKAEHKPQNTNSSGAAGPAVIYSVMNGFARQCRVHSVRGNEYAGEIETALKKRLFEVMQMPRRAPNHIDKYNI